MKQKVYLEILVAFGVKHQFDELLETSSNYVTMDHIHDAIIRIGVHTNFEAKRYVMKAKQIAIDEMKRTGIRTRLLRRRGGVGFGVDMSTVSLVDCDFTSTELDIIGERLAGIPACRSAFKRAEYSRLLASIKVKLVSATIRNATHSSQ